MKRCARCGKRVSDDKRKCPNCGSYSRVESSFLKIAIRDFGYFLLLTGIVYIIIWLVSS
jgi:hypothetical protein